MADMPDNEDKSNGMNVGRGAEGVDLYSKPTL